METPPAQDPGPGNRPLGILALVTVAVRPIRVTPIILALTLGLG